MGKFWGAVVLLVLSLVAVSWGRKQETLEELIARADAAKPDHQSKLYLDVAEREMDALMESYKKNDWNNFRSELQQVVNYCGKAHTAAIQSDKKLKGTEIKIREISGKLRDLKLNVDFDDEAVVQTAINQLEGFRTDLLQKMFGPKQ